MSYLQIGSWNIEHLSGQARATRKQSAYALADHIEMAGVDMLVLQEIYLTDPDEEVKLFDHMPVITSRAHTARRNSDLDIVCYLLEEHLDASWKYVILPNRNPDDDSQLCAVMWNMSRVDLNKVIPLAVKHSENGKSLWDRKPHLVSFKSKLNTWRKNAEGKWEELPETRTISVVPLHMKANSGAGPLVTSQTRAMEATTLCDALDALREELDKDFDPSLMLIGDTNILTYDEPALLEFVNRGFIDLNNTDATTYWSKNYQSPFDRALVAAGRPEFKYSRQYVLRSADMQLHDKYLSDHLMIKVSVKDYVDDADPR